MKLDQVNIRCLCVHVDDGTDVCVQRRVREIEVKDPCACESLVEFQQATMSSLEQLTQKHILSKNILEQMPALILESKLRFVTL